MSYDWPGNVRELENVIERALVLSDSDGFLGPVAFSEAMRMEVGREKEGVQTLREKVGEVEKKAIEIELEQHGWNKTKAAQALGLSRRGLRNKIGSYGIKVPE